MFTQLQVNHPTLIKKKLPKIKQSKYLVLYYFYPTVASLEGMSFNKGDAHKQGKLFLLYPHHIPVKNVL